MDRNYRIGLQVDTRDDVPPELTTGQWVYRAKAYKVLDEKVEEKLQAIFAAYKPRMDKAFTGSWQTANGYSGNICRLKRQVL